MFSTSGFSQISSNKKDTTELKSFNINNDLGELIGKKKFNVDSIKINSKRYQDKSENKIQFRKSKYFFQLDIYLENNEFLMITTIEKSTKFQSYENAIKVRYLYFQKGIKVDEKIRTGIPKGLHGIGLPSDFDFDKAYGYDKNITTELIMKLSKLIFIEMTK